MADPNGVNTVLPGGNGNLSGTNFTVNSSVLQPTPAIPYATPAQTPIPSVDGLMSDGTATLTQPETQASSLTSRLQDLNNQLVGKSADQSAAENAAGIPGLQQTQNDLQTQVQQLANEAKAIPQQLQLDATGRGITAGGLQPVQTAALRNNAIAALSASSLLDATKGLLASAQQKADRAVAAKYDPIQAQIDAATKNLKLIIDSPEYSVADKNRANAQLLVQKQQQAQLDKSKADASTIMSWAADAVKNGATAYQAQQIAQIAQSSTPDLQAAFKLYSPYATDPNATQKALLDLQLERANINKVNADASKASSDAAISAADNVDVSTIAANTTNPNATQSSLGGLTLNGLIQKAQTYLTNGGNIQGLGLSNSGKSGVQRTLIANYGGYLAGKMGLDIPQITALYKANSKAATQIIGRVAKIDATSASLTAQFPRLAELAGKVGDLGISEQDITAGKAAAMRKFNNVDAANYIELIQTVRSDYSAMQAAVAGSTGAQYFSEAADKAIPIGATPDVYNGLADTIKQSADNASVASGNEANKLLGITPSNNATTTSGTTASGLSWTISP